jgi:hypothetical protein
VDKLTSGTATVTRVSSAREATSCVLDDPGPNPRRDFSIPHDIHADFMDPPNRLMRDGSL